jgi:uncharacterized protein
MESNDNSEWSRGDRDLQGKLGPMDISYTQGAVTATVRGGKASVGVLLAHGAGAGMDHPWMTAMADGLAAGGLRVMTFNYPYTEFGRKTPNRMPLLLEVHRAAAETLRASCDQVVLAGKSMGGRVGSHLAGDEGWPAAAMVYFGYPLLAIGKTEPRATDHLQRIEVPQLFVSGTRDRLGPIDLITAVAAAVPEGTVIAIEHGDHSFKVPKSTGATVEEVLAMVATDTANWIRRSLSL